MESQFSLSFSPFPSPVIHRPCLGSTMAFPCSSESKYSLHSHLSPPLTLCAFSSISVIIPLSLSLSLTHTHSLSLVSLFASLSLAFSLSLSLALSLSLSLTISLSLYISLPLHPSEDDFRFTGRAAAACSNSPPQPNEMTQQKREIAKSANVSH